MGDQDYRLLTISVQNRPLAGLNGQPMLDDRGNAVGNVPTGSASLLHWMDPELAIGWRAEARRRVDAAVANRDPAALIAAGRAVMLVYDALNVPWVTDPVGRLLYQAYVAGPPSLGGAGRFVNEYRGGAAYPYNDNVWLAANQPLLDAGRTDPNHCIVIPPLGGHYFGGCVTDLTTPPRQTLPYAGAIPAGTRGVINRHDWGAVPDPTQHPSQFLDRMQFAVVVPNGSALPVDQQRRVPLPFDLGLLTAPQVRNALLTYTTRSFSGGDPADAVERLQTYVHLDGSDATTDPDGWDVYGFDSNYTLASPNVPERMRPSYEDYAPWLDRWVTALEARTPAQIVQDARGYTMFRNGLAASVNGGAASLAGAITNVSDAQLAANPAVVNDIHIAAAATAALGVALAAPTAGISALIGGAASAILVLAATLSPPDLALISVDDLQRPKPWFERAWLGGVGPGSQGPEGAPSLSIDAPPGWVRPLSTLARTGPVSAALRIRAGSFVPPAPAPPPPLVGADGSIAGVPVWAWVSGALVFLGLLAYAGSTLAGGTGPRRAHARSSVRSNPSRRRYGRRHRRSHRR